MPIQKSVPFAAMILAGVASASSGVFSGKAAPFFKPGETSPFAETNITYTISGNSVDNKLTVQADFQYTIVNSSEKFNDEDIYYLWGCLEWQDPSDTNNSTPYLCF